MKNKLESENKMNDQIIQKRKRFQRKINRRKEQRNTTIMSNQELNKIKNLIQQIKREKSSEKRQQLIVQVLELMTIIL